MLNEPVDPEKLAAVARRYHHNGETQEQIAKDLRVAQGTVSNWLTLARDRGVVAVDIDPKVALTGTEHQDLSRKLRDQCGLRECLVIDPIKPAAYADVRADVLHIVIANTAGRIRLREWVQSGDHVVVGGGRALLRAMRLIKRTAPTRRDVCVSPLCGRIWTGTWQDAGPETLERPMDADDVARLLGFAFEHEPGTRISQIGRPLYAEDAQAARRIIEEECMFQPGGRWNTRGGFPTPVRALVGVGVLHPRSGHRIIEYLDNGAKHAYHGPARHLAPAVARFTEARRFAESNHLPYIGDVANRLFPALPLPMDLRTGHPLPDLAVYARLSKLLGDLNSQAVVMEWAHLRGIPYVCALAGGELKLRVLFTLLICDQLGSDKGSALIKELVTDLKTAENLVSCLRDFEHAPPEVRDWYQAIAPTIFASTTKTKTVRGA